MKTFIVYTKNCSDFSAKGKETKVKNASFIVFLKIIFIEILLLFWFLKLPLIYFMV